jgi:hypothetical protein
MIEIHRGCDKRANRRRAQIHAPRHSAAEITRAIRACASCSIIVPPIRIANRQHSVSAKATMERRRLCRRIYRNTVASRRPFSDGRLNSNGRLNRLCAESKELA